MIPLATLPLEYARSFSLHLYTIGHGLLLLRSGKTTELVTRVDIAFYDVRWMVLPNRLNGLRIEKGQISDIPLPLTEMIKKEAHFMSVYRLSSEGVMHYLLADAVRVMEDEKDYMDNSPLLPYCNLRAFSTIPKNA